MTDEAELRKRIDERGLKLKFIAGVCGLSYQGFLNKLTNASEFTASEILKLRELLGLSAEDAEGIFFIRK